MKKEEGKKHASLLVPDDVAEMLQLKGKTEIGCCRSRPEMRLAGLRPR